MLTLTTRQKLLLVVGSLALLVGVMIPSGWFVPLPASVRVPAPPIAGHVVFRFALFVEGLALVWLGLRTSAKTWEPAFHVPMPSVVGATVDDAGDAAGARLYGWLVVGVTLLALVLRLIAINSDLWMDEITPVQGYRNASAWQVAITYRSSNNHLLNTLIVKAAIAVFGEHEWSIRLPAVLWGTASIPALYWVARQALSRHASLCAAGLLAVSYHHVFFSQNARGYSAYVFLSLVSSGLLVNGLKTDARRTWVAYVAATVLNFSVILISGFVFAAHVLVSALAVMTIPREAHQRGAAVRRLLWVFAITAFLGFQLYAAALPQMYVLMRVVYTEATSGYSAFSLELVREVARGLGAGFGPGLLLGAVPLLALAAAGYVILVRRHWILALALTLPCVLQAVLLVVEGFTFSPRFFILALPLAILVAVHAIATAAGMMTQGLRRSDGFARLVTTVVVLLLGAASVAALPRYYQTPKQAFRSALTHVEAARQPDGIVIAIHYAEAGIRYYRRRAGMSGSPDYFEARTVESFDEILAAHPNRPVWLVTTFPRALRLGVPDLDARIRRDWEIDQRYPGTIGDGDLFVWKERRP